MTRCIAVLCLTAASQGVFGAELTRDQELIVACHNVDVRGVVRCLRAGASVNARLGKENVEETLFRDRWTGGYSAFTDLWTPLIALANSPRYPPPPPELGEIWKDHARALARLRQIPKVEIDKRRADSITILNILLSHGCELDAADAMGATALFDAALEDKVLMVEALLDFGANPNTKTGTYFHNPSDMTPLHAAAGRSRQVIQLLLDHGADPLAKDDAGRTPADWIAEDPDSDIDLLKTPDGWRVVPRAKKPPEDSGGAKTGDP